MVAQIKPTTKNSPPVKTGANRNNKPASVYAKPHDMTGKEVKISADPGKPSDISSAANMKMSVGNYNNGQNETKTSGIKMRGTGAATKGLMSRGPMA
jgi:hypothetical protein